MKIETEKKFLKLGRSWGIIIPPQFFKMLNIEPKKDMAQISIEDDKIVIKKK